MTLVIQGPGASYGRHDASEAQSVSAATLLDTGNSNTSTLAAGQTWTGTWVDTRGYAQAVTSFRATQTGEFTLQYSSDASTVHSAIGPKALAANTNSPQTTTPSRRYYRVVYSNTSGSTATLAIETTLRAAEGTLTSRLNDTVSATAVATLARAVLCGVDDNDTTYRNVGVTERNALEVETVGPLGAFGEVLTTHPEPRVQIDAVYGLRDTDTETLTDGSSGVASAANSVFSVATGTTIGGYAVIHSRRMIRYSPGQGVRVRFTAAFTSPGAANSLQLAGAFSAIDGLFFGYSGTSFGILRRIAGALQIVRLTVTTGATGAGTITITLNGVTFNVAVGGALSTAATAEAIAEGATYTGWSSVVSPQSNDSTVTWIQQTPGTAAGTYSISGAGTAGSFATLKAGAANDQATGFVAQTAWNVDTMDGDDDSSNPSGVLLDPTKLNVYEIVYPYLGAGTIRFRVMSPSSGRFVTVHRIAYPNTAVIPSQRNPALRLGWIAASLGSTTNLSVIGASAAGFTEGTHTDVRDPFAADTTFTATTTEHVVLAMRSRGEFQSVVNLREVFPLNISCATETSNRVVRVRVYLNPTMTGTVNWSYVDQANSVVEKATPSSITPSGGRLIATVVVASGSGIMLHLDELDLRMEPGDTLVVSAAAVSSTASCSMSINWTEK